MRKDKYNILLLSNPWYASCIKNHTLMSVLNENVWIMHADRLICFKGQYVGEKLPLIFIILDKHLFEMRPGVELEVIVEVLMGRYKLTKIIRSKDFYNALENISVDTAIYIDVEQPT